MGLDVGTRNGLLSVRTVHTCTCTADWFYCCTVPGTTEQVSHRRGDTGAVVLATKIRLENGNDHIMDKKKAMTAVRSKRK